MKEYFSNIFFSYLRDWRRHKVHITLVRRTQGYKDAHTQRFAG